MLNSNKTPLAVVISDVHYTLGTLKEADYAFRHAIDTASRLKVSLIDCGDLTNDKAILRAECVNTIISTMEYAADNLVDVFCLVGNHSLLNEKRPEHSLHFLSLMRNVTVISHPAQICDLNFIPYQSSAQGFIDALHKFPEGSIVFGHQGTKGGHMGDYIKDPTAFDHNLTGLHKILLGHYHQHYELGTTVSIGNPYTLTFGEANDEPKGYLIVYTDGSFERVLLPELRRHVILQYTTQELDIYDCSYPVRPIDLVWIKVRGSASELAKIKKNDIGDNLFGHNNFKLDKIVTESAPVEAKADDHTGEQLFDMVIDSTADSEDHKNRLKALWRSLA